MNPRLDWGGKKGRTRSVPSKRTVSLEPEHEKPFTETGSILVWMGFKKGMCKVFQLLLTFARRFYEFGKSAGGKNG